MNTPLASYLPPIMKTTYWTYLLESVEEVIDDIKETYIDTLKDLYSLSDSEEEVLLELASTVYQLDLTMLENLLDFLTEIEMYDGSDEDTARARALERLRQELMKIPFSMDKRGTLSFYTSLFEFCGFNYPGVVSLIRTSQETQIGALITDISLEKYEADSTCFALPIEDSDDLFSGISTNTYETLDYQESGIYATLDAGDNATLDMAEYGSTLAYRKALLLGLIINNTTAQYYSTGAMVGTDSANPDYYYAGAPTFPESMGRYYLSFLELNKRATDIIVFGPFLGLNIVNSVTDDSLISDYRMDVVRVNNSAIDPLSALLLTYSDGEEVFYEEQVTNFQIGSDYASVLGFCQGELCYHETELEFVDRGDGFYNWQITIPRDGWNENFSLKVFATSTTNVNNSVVLYYRDTYDRIIQRSTNADVETEATWTENEDGDIVITITNTAGTSVSTAFNRAAYMSQYLNSAVKEIKLYSFTRNDDNSRNQTEIASISFAENTQIELAKGVTLTTYLCVHF